MYCVLQVTEPYKGNLQLNCLVHQEEVEVLEDRGLPYSNLHPSHGDETLPRPDGPTDSRIPLLKTPLYDYTVIERFKTTLSIHYY